MRARRAPMATQPPATTFIDVSWSKKRYPPLRMMIVFKWPTTWKATADVFPSRKHAKTFTPTATRHDNLNQYSEGWKGRFISMSWRGWLQENIFLFLLTRLFACLGSSNQTLYMDFCR